MHDTSRSFDPLLTAFATLQPDGMNDELCLFIAARMVEACRQSELLIAMCFRAQNAKTAKNQRRQNVAKISKRRDPRDPSDEICGHSLTRSDGMVDEHRSSWRSAPHWMPTVSVD